MGPVLTRRIWIRDGDLEQFMYRWYLLPNRPEGEGEGGFADEI